MLLLSELATTLLQKNRRQETIATSICGLEPVLMGKSI